jgi:hypothetical protein
MLPRSACRYGERVDTPLVELQQAATLLFPQVDEINGGCCSCIADAVGERAAELVDRGIPGRSRTRRHRKIDSHAHVCGIRVADLYDRTSHLGGAPDKAGHR